MENASCSDEHARARERERERERGVYEFLEEALNDFSLFRNGIFAGPFNENESNDELMGTSGN